MVEPERLRTKLGKLEQYLRGLEDKQNCPRAEYRADRDLQAIVERRFETATQASIDIASHVVASEGFREPDSYGELFIILAEEDICSTETAERMREMAGFRNVLAHDYAEIDDDRVYDHLQDVEHFRTFAEEIGHYLED
jgi:uncharacterized protein YutE (UPF0331/DUF86 family)